MKTLVFFSSQTDDVNGRESSEGEQQMGVLPSYGLATLTVLMDLQSEAK